MCSAHTVHLCVLCGSENKQRLFPYTALTGLYNRDGMCLVRSTDWMLILGFKGLAWHFNNTKMSHFLKLSLRLHWFNSKVTSKALFGSRLEISIVVTLRILVFWDVTLCSKYFNASRRFVVTWRLHLRQPVCTRKLTAPGKQAIPFPGPTNTRRWRGYIPPKRRDIKLPDK